MSNESENLIQLLKNLPAIEGALLIKEYRERRAAQEKNVRMYSAAKQSRLTSGWGQLVTSADYELNTSLRVMQARARALIRDASYAKRAKMIVINNVVGSGIGVQAQVKTSRGELNDSINSEIEETWEDWCLADTCHTGGVLNFADIERLTMGQVFDVGEIFIRKYSQPFGASKIPFALEIIEPERIVDEFQPSSPLANAIVRMGIECDQFRRPIAYWIRKLHPGEYRYSPGETDAYERIPANQIIHLKITDRWPQTRGEPWMHTAMRKLNDIDGYSEAEIVAARGAAAYMGIVETREEYGQTTETGEKEIVIEPGIVERLDPGDKFTFVNPNRPNSNVDPFIRLMLREIAAGTGVSYESLSRDYSQSNYSSSRLALLDDRDLWRVTQLWFIRNFRMLIHREWLQQAILSRAIESISIEAFAQYPKKFMAVRFKPRGWTWIDPEKEVKAYKEAIKAGLTTTTDVIALTGGGKDIEDVLDDRQHELDMMKQKGLIFDTDAAYYGSSKTPPPAAVKSDEDDDKKMTIRDLQLVAKGGR
jgi:lambda family phage portal protein